MSDNWKNEGQNKTEYDKNQQGGQHDPSQRPGQPGQTDQDQQKPDQRRQDNPSQHEQNNPQKKAS